MGSPTMTLVAAAANVTDPLITVCCGCTLPSPNMLTVRPSNQVNPLMVVTGVDTTTATVPKPSSDVPVTVTVKVLDVSTVTV